MMLTATARAHMLTASAQLKPMLKPPWYARGKVTMYSPGCCMAANTGTLRRRSYGERTHG